MLSEQQALEVLKRDGYLFDIGQLTHETRLTLARMVRKGRVSKSTAQWPWIHSGTITKTIYRPTGKD